MFAARWRRQDTNDGDALLHEGDGDGPAASAAQIILGAIDGIDDPETAPLDPVRLIERFLGKPTGLGIERGQMLAEEGIDFQIHVADGMARHLLPTPILAAGPAVGDPPRLSRDSGN